MRRFKRVLAGFIGALLGAASLWQAPLPEMPTPDIHAPDVEGPVPAPVLRSARPFAPNRVARTPQVLDAVTVEPVEAPVVEEAHPGWLTGHVTDADGAGTRAVVHVTGARLTTARATSPEGAFTIRVPEGHFDVFASVVDDGEESRSQVATVGVAVGQERYLPLEVLRGDGVATADVELRDLLDGYEIVDVGVEGAGGLEPGDILVEVEGREAGKMRPEEIRAVLTAPAGAVLGAVVLRGAGLERKPVTIGVHAPRER